MQPTIKSSDATNSPTTENMKLNGCGVVGSKAARKVPHRAALLFASVALSACGAFYTSIDEASCPPSGTKLSYENFGAPFLATYCQSCHGSNAVDRAGAPGDYIFDTHEQAKRHRARIFARSAADNDSMPPGPDDPPRADRDKLAEWLACGAP